MTITTKVILLQFFFGILQICKSSIVFNDESTTQSSTLVEVYSKFSRKELECFKQGKVLFEPEGKCYKLLEKGPCIEEKQWLVLDKEEVTDGRGQLRAVCRQCACCGKPYRAVYWPDDGQCYNIFSESKTLCPLLGTVLQIDPFGEGACECIKDPPHARREDRNSISSLGACYPLYSRGPCDSGYIFISTNNTVRCKKDPCAEFNHRTGDVKFVLWEDGNGRCYRLGSKGPCQGESSSFEIHPISRRPACVSRINQIVDLPPTCDTDQNGHCRQEIALPSEAEYVSDLIQAAQKKRYKRRTKAGKTTRPLK